MTEARGARPCPGCGSVVDTQFCPHCGSRTVPDTQTFGPYQNSELPTIPSMPVVPMPVVPMSNGPVPELIPGWTGRYSAVETGVLAPPPERRRKAIYAVLAVAATTVIVLVAVLLIAPHLGSSGSVADKDGQPIVVGSPVVSSPVTSADSSANEVAPLPAPSGPPAGSVPVRTVTVTRAPTAPATTTVPRTTVPKTTAPKTTAQKTTAPKTTAPKTTTPASPLGVPQKNIACSAGYIVQLASELDAKTFTARVARLKATGQVPSGALAADSAASCKIFTSQSNTLVLYAGPFASPYDGCAARLAGPADAYIKGGNPATSSDYISCLCPTVIKALPEYRAVGQQGVWVGEAQRVLGNRLNIDVPDLSGNWGTYTPGTKAAVVKFQQSVRLPATGVLDRRTWQALQRAECR